MNGESEAFALLRLQLVDFHCSVTAAPLADPQISQAFEKRIGVGEIEMVWPVSKITFFSEIEINQPGLGVQLIYWIIVNGWCCPIGVLFFCGSPKNRVIQTWKWFIYLRIRKTNLVCFSIFRLLHPFVVIVDLWPTIPKNKQVDIVSYLPWHSCTRVWVINTMTGFPGFPSRHKSCVYTEGIKPSLTKFNPNRTSGGLGLGNVVHRHGLDTEWWEWGFM